MPDYTHAYSAQLFDLSAYKVQPGTDVGPPPVDGPEPINTVVADFVTANKAGPDPAALGNGFRGGLYSLSAINNSFQLVSGGTIGDEYSNEYYGRVTTLAFHLSTNPNKSPQVPVTQNDNSSAHSLDKIRWCIDPVRGTAKTGLSGKTGVKIANCYLETGGYVLEGTAQDHSFALITDQGFTVLYTAATGSGTISPTASGWNLASWPGLRRKVQMGMI